MFGQNISSNITHFFIPGDKIQNWLWRIKNLKFPSNSSLSCIFILCGTNNVDDNSPEEIVSELISSGISIQAQCHCAKVVTILLLTCDKTFSLSRENINIIHLLLEPEYSKHKLYTSNHKPEWLNVDESLNKLLFYIDNLHLVKEGSELLAKEIVAFYKSLKSHNYPNARSYKNVSLFYLKNSDFPKLERCYSNYASSKVKLNWNISFQKPTSVTFADNCKYISTSKSWMLLSHNKPLCKKTVTSPSISHVSMLLKFVNSTIPGQNIQCTNAPKSLLLVVL